MITVATFSTPEEAHLLRLRLGAGGIDAYVQDEHTVQMNWLYSNAIGGVRVQIDEADLEIAREIVATPPLKSDAAAEAEPTECPECASTQTAPDELPRRMAFLSLLVFGFPLPFLRRRWRCADCGHKWKSVRGE